MGLIKVLTANMYVGNPTDKKAAQKLLDLHPHVMMLQEAQNTLDTLKDVFKGEYRFAYNQSCYGGKEVPVLVLDTMHNGGKGDLWGCSEVPDSKVGKNRWTTYQVTRLPGADDRRAVLGTHLNAAVQNDDGTLKNNNVTDKYHRHYTQIRATLNMFKKIGWSPIFGADWNYRLKGKIDTASEAADDSPYGLAREYGLKYVAQGLDGILFDPDVFRLDHTQRIPGADYGSDHDWLMVFLEAK